MLLRFLRLYLLLPFILISFNASAQFSYISPVPGSKYHNPETNIILKNGSPIDESSLKSADLFSVTGTLTGRHDLDVILSDDQKTVMLQPTTTFFEGETVTVLVNDGMRTATGKTVKGTSFNFYLREPRTPEMQQRLDDTRRQIYETEFGAAPDDDNNTVRDLSDWMSGLPPFDIWVNTNPAPGDIFFNNLNFSGYETGHYCIITSEGDSLYGKYDLARGINFYLNHNGYMTLYNQTLSQFEVLDSNYAVISKLRCKNGYKADVHECQMFNDGHCLLMAYDPQQVDMTVYDSTYNPNATVTGLILQELDDNKNVVFQWRSWDHFDIFDAIHIGFATSAIDYVHGNSIELDYDNNLLISCRHMDEITKIDHNTGDIIWRMGGKNNQFTFVGDTQMFCYQHDVRRIANGNITVFDNGNLHQPPISSVKEYQVDEVNKIATLVWSYKRGIFGTSVAMGSAQRLPNGNTFICWGLAYSADFPTITEVDPDGNVVWEMRLDNEFNDGIYRAHKFDWSPCSRPTITSLKSIGVTQTSAKLKWSTATNAASYEVQYKKSTVSGWTTIPASNSQIVLNGLQPGTKYNWRIRTVCNMGGVVYSGYTPKVNFTTLPQKMEPLNAKSSIVVYPNPARDVIHVSAELVENSHAVIRLFNVLGQQVYVADVIGPSGEEIFDIPAENLAPGMYFVEVLTGEETLEERVIIQ